MDDADVTHLLPILLPTDPSLSRKLLIVRMEAEAGIEPAIQSDGAWSFVTR